MFVRMHPEIARKFAEPLGRTEKMVVNNSGNEGGGASKLAGDITQIIAQLLSALEALTGKKLAKLVQQVPGLRRALEHPGPDV